MKMYQVDAFTQQLFKGNPAAVLVLDDWLDDALMQNIALENNLAETAFVKRIDDENYQIRWFTPQVEVDFCGHATLASAFVLFKDYTQAKTIHFHVKDLGIFIIQQAEDGKIQMNFPIRQPQKVIDYPELLNHVIDQPFKEVYLNAQAYILVCESAQDVINATPNLPNIRKIAEQYHVSTALTAESAGYDVTITAASNDYDYVARYFAPHKGIDEDPVTGSMHTGLAPLWAEKLGKTQLIGYQASARGGKLFCDIQDSQRIEISGYAQLFMQAEIFI
ncbi:PhzF family phenazine biosynthesis isomerase [Acinetobacter sp. RIT698]|uniref:PhzF family phenazine biosynthesis protein n=1 Tax=Acinetobacter TaxID=469 RepID=UPI0012AC5CCE|nr:PhzF family phenazine biosynthesis protein [Acinetobacter sp. RIT698]MDN5418758.1 PhzF family phenazine biosynthesis protein [Acinetobacter sp.]MDN5489717.1 PhzF family phenazine biosynthesis protein [Acinetobacter sp.]MDN5623951.1 PhzF family phenazine biosynthesis protein [Acinetobacter sp.]MDN5647075.1 PhzF family phenazine biosynthesis protein [Acinetobacter sp.]MDN5689277.1 PhzF family phenazine biosynthesis protein [Acinetobacter sp.]